MGEPLYYLRRRLAIRLGELGDRVCKWFAGLRKGLSGASAQWSRKARKRAGAARAWLKHKWPRSYRRALGRALSRLVRSLRRLVVPALLLGSFWLFTSRQLPPVRVANATVSGVMARHAVWSGTIRVAGDVVVPPQFLLRIEPGTRVEFLVQDDQSAGPAMGGVVPGNITDPTASGSYARTHSSLSARIVATNVTFTSAAAEPGYADWSELVLYNGSRLGGSTVEYTRGGVVLMGSNVTLTGVESQYALWNCLEDRGGGRVLDCDFHHCWHSCVDSRGNLTMVGSTLQECREGVRLGAEPRELRSNLVIKVCEPLVSGNLSVELGRGLLYVDKPVESEGGTYGGRLVYPVCR